MSLTPPPVTGTAAGAPAAAGGPGATAGLDAERLAVALEAAQLGLWEWDLTTDAITWDARSTSMYGLDGVELSGTVSDINRTMHPDDADRVAAALAQVVADAGAVDLEFRVVHPDGQVRWLYARGQVLVDARGAAVRMIGTNADVTAARRAEHQQVQDASRRAALVTVAQQLGRSTTEQEVLAVVVPAAGDLLGAQGGIVGLIADGGDGGDGGDGRVLRTASTGYLDEGARADVAEMALDTPLPLVVAAATGEEVFSPDAPTTLARFPRSRQLWLRSRTEASAAVPLRADGEDGEVFGALAFSLPVAHAWRDADVELVRALAALTAQVLARIAAQEARERSEAEVRRFSETLQRSLLTSPVTADHLQVAVRYVPAAAQAQVGGDWYDAFGTSDGATTVVIGDVTGHDRVAAAGMAQLRNLLRGITYTLSGSPAAALAALDRAVDDLQVGVMASVVLAQVEQTPEQRAAGHRLLRWSNAGHPPPLLIEAGGAVRVLATDADLLVGFSPDAERSDHTAVLHDGATVLLYTDGLVERRGVDLDAGLAWLVATVGALAAAGADAEQLCDRLLEAVGGRVDDDVALVALRVHPEPPVGQLDGSAPGGR